MEALFLYEKGSFYDACNHIALYRTSASESYQNLIKDALKRANVRRPADFLAWDVPNLSKVIYKVVPVEVNGKNIFLDEAALEGRSVEDTIAAPVVPVRGPEGISELYKFDPKMLRKSVIKFSVITDLLRQKGGGRIYYDWKVLNAALLTGATAGGAVLFFGLRRSSWFRRRSYVRLLAATGVCWSTAQIAKYIYGNMGFGAFAAERIFSKAGKSLACEDCIAEVRQFLESQEKQLKDFKLTPQSEKMPPELYSIVEKNVKVGAELMRSNALLMKRIGQGFAGKKCTDHSEFIVDTREAKC